MSQTASGVTCSLNERARVGLFATLSSDNVSIPQVASKIVVVALRFCAGDAKSTESWQERQSLSTKALMPQAPVMVTDDDLKQAYGNVLRFGPREGFALVVSRESFEGFWEGTRCDSLKGRVLQGKVGRGSLPHSLLRASKSKAMQQDTQDLGGAVVLTRSVHGRAFDFATDGLLV